MHDKWSSKCLKHRLVSKLQLFQGRYLKIWLFLFAPRCTQTPGQVLCSHRTCFLQRRSATSVVQNSWLMISQGPTWQLGVLELFSLWWVFNGNCLMHCDLSEPTREVSNCKTIKAPFACLGARTKFEGDMNKNFEAIWDIKDGLVFLFRSSLCCSS